MTEFDTVSSRNENERIFLLEQLSNSKNYLEFGSGASTLMALTNPNLSIVSIDSSQEYIDFLGQKIEVLQLPISKVRFYVADIGPTGDWGRPLDDSAIAKFHNYALSAFEFLESIQFSPDLILIDGRFRVATFLNTFLNCPGAIVLFEDYYNRPEYFVVEALLMPADRCGRIALFQIPVELEKLQTLRAFNLIQRHLLEVN